MSSPTHFHPSPDGQVTHQRHQQDPPHQGFPRVVFHHPVEPLVRVARSSISKPIWRRQIVVVVQ